MAQTRKPQKPIKKPDTAGENTRTAKLLKPNPAEKLIQDVTNRYRVTAREARDIVTAISNAGVALGKASQKGNKNDAAGKARQAVMNIPKQVTEAGKTAVTGKPGTTSSGSRLRFK